MKDCPQKNVRTKKATVEMKVRSVLSSSSLGFPPLWDRHGRIGRHPAPPGAIPAVIPAAGPRAMVAVFLLVIPKNMIDESLNVAHMLSYPWSKSRGRRGSK